MWCEYILYQIYIHSSAINLYKKKQITTVDSNNDDMVHNDLKVLVIIIIATFVKITLLDYVMLSAITLNCKFVAQQ